MCAVVKTWRFFFPKRGHQMTRDLYMLSIPNLPIWRFPHVMRGPPSSSIFAMGMLHEIHHPTLGWPGAPAFGAFGSFGFELLKAQPARQLSEDWGHPCGSPPIFPRSWNCWWFQGFSHGFSQGFWFMWSQDLHQKAPAMGFSLSFPRSQPASAPSCGTGTQISGCLVEKHGDLSETLEFKH